MTSIRTGLKWETSRPKPDAAAPKPDILLPEPARAAPLAPRPAIRDGWMRVIGIPFFGLVIPRMTGLLGNLTLADPLYWAGTVYFIVVAAIIWQGNRWLLFKQRAHLNWFARPVLKLIMLVAANIVYTAPVTITLTWLWLRFIAAPFFMLNWAMINLATAYVVIAVIFFGRNVGMTAFTGALSFMMNHSSASSRLSLCTRVETVPEIESGGMVST